MISPLESESTILGESQKYISRISHEFILLIQNDTLIQTLTFENRLHGMHILLKAIFYIGSEY